MISAQLRFKTNTQLQDLIDELQYMQELLYDDNYEELKDQLSHQTGTIETILENIKDVN